MRKNVTVRPCSHGNYTHRVRHPGPDGKTVSRYFKNETSALAFAKAQSAALGRDGRAFGSMSADERAVLEFWRGFVKRNEETPPPPLLEVLRDYAAQWEASRSSVTVEKAVESYEATKEAEGLRPRSLQTIAVRCGRFADDFRGRPLSSITTSEISDWILALRALPPGRKPEPVRAKAKARPLGLEAKRNYRMALHGLFTFAKGRGWVNDNPVTDAARPKPRRSQPGILRPDDVARLLAAIETEVPEILPFWAVRFFAGIREQEAVRMDWSSVNLRENEIHLPGEITKTNQPRTLKIEPALAAFLKPHARRDGPLCPLSEMGRRLRFKRALAKLEAEDAAAGKDARPFPAPIPPNAARHSFATYHLLHFRHAGETAIQLGHGGSPEMLHRHYKGIATASEAAEFWSIRPTGEAPNVVEFKHPAEWPDDETLQRMLWEKPAVEIARSIGVSDKAVEKRAAKAGLTKPPRGHWSTAKKAANREEAR